EVEIVGHEEAAVTRTQSRQQRSHAVRHELRPTRIRLARHAREALARQRHRILKTHRLGALAPEILELDPELARRLFALRTLVLADLALQGHPPAAHVFELPGERAALHFPLAVRARHLLGRELDGGLHLGARLLDLRPNALGLVVALFALGFV